MLRIRLKGSLPLVLLFLGSMMAAVELSAHEVSDRENFLRAEPVVRTRTLPTLSPEAFSFLLQRDHEQASVWVFFADKGFTDEPGFQQAARHVVLTDRAARRRARVGKDRIVFADLPVHQQYVELLVELGASHRRSSRWLNAASFDIPLELLPQLDGLPFVAGLRPVARFAAHQVGSESDRVRPPAESQSVDDLDYGLSQTQIHQINAAFAHAQGYTGRGVTLAIMDTGFRKSHTAFASHFAENRVLAEYDFVMNDSNTAQEAGDVFGQWNHGTMTWSVAGGLAPGQVIGPAYGANFILCKTEDLGSETPVEEDNWVAALEFADSIGVDVISTSLCYSDWYDFEDLDGQIATITLAANLCDGLGIVMVTAMGNDGPAPETLLAPADAFDILAVGAVNATGTITAFSSRGPTFDLRVKPEVCAMGTDVRTASASDDNSYRYGDGTSFATPLVAGAAAVLLEARPEFTPAMVREALKTTAGRAAEVDCTYGWGIIDLGRALTWPVEFELDILAGKAPLMVSFANHSVLAAESLTWEFGDGATSSDPAPTHVYQTPGVYDVTLTIDTEMGQFSRTVPDLISVHADTLQVENVLGIAGMSNRVDVYVRNFLPLKEIEVPFSWAGELDLSLDSFSTAGLRTAYFSTQSMLSYDEDNKRATVFLRSSGTVGEPALEPGAGPVISLFFTLPYQPGTGIDPIELIAYGSYRPSLLSGSYAYQPTVISGSVRLGCCFGRVGDVNGQGGDEPTLADVSLLIDHLFINEPPLECYAEADINQSGGAGVLREDISIGDIAVLINYLFITGSSLGLPDCL